MTREQLLRAVGDIRDTFIREAAPPPASYRKRREFPWAGAVAACLALVIVGSTFFLSRLGVGSGATSSDTAAATEDTAENATAGESGGAMDGADDSAQEAEAAAPTVTVDGTVYMLADSGPWPETCPAGLVQAGEAELPDTGERCPCFAPPEDTGEIWVYQTCRDPETGTAYKGYVRYVAETPD